MNFPTINFSSEFYLKHFGERIQRIPLSSGFSCPNRDGSKSREGCIYCNNNSFSPFYIDANDSISTQLEKGISFFASKYKTKRFLAYFQTYSSTYGSLEQIKSKVEEALKHPQIEGIILGTRPDCIDSEKLLLLKSICKSNFLKIELGIESFSQKTLDFLNRSHSVEESKQAIALIKSNNIFCGVHLILGLPNETNDFIANSAKAISKLKVDFVKLHHLQVIKETKLADIYAKSPESLNLQSKTSYQKLLFEFLQNLSPDIYVERFLNRVPAKYLIAPIWGGITESEFRKDLVFQMEKLEFFQGKSNC